MSPLHLKTVTNVNSFELICLDCVQKHSSSLHEYILIIHGRAFFFSTTKVRRLYNVTKCRFDVFSFKALAPDDFKEVI